MKILISNDDGIYAPGLNTLAKNLAEIAEIIVIAPDRNRSAASNSLTLNRPLRVKSLDNGYYSVDGTPTDCVHLALTGLFNETIDIVVSGINDGGNLGDDVLYSGTVAAAMEGRYLGLPAVAFSMVGDNIQHFDTAAYVAKYIIGNLSLNMLPPQTILNVNIPDLPLDNLKGLQITRLGTRHLAERTLKQYDPRGRPVYWIGPPGVQADAGIGTDFFAVSQGYVSITPLNLNMTHYNAIDPLNHWANTINLNFV